MNRILTSFAVLLLLCSCSAQRHEKGMAETAVEIAAEMVPEIAPDIAPDIAPRPNVLVITVDDMNADSVGAFGASMKGTTPHIDQLAQQGLRFNRAHVQVANCMPSRNVMWSGLYPHTNQVEGFTQVREPGYATLSDLLQGEGYFTAIRHKITHSTPYVPYAWDQVLDTTSAQAKHHKKDPQSYGASVAAGIKSAEDAGKPFYLLINIADPHLPFYGLNRKGKAINDPYKPSRVYQPEEVAVPGFLPDDPVVRQELSHYYSTVRRADDAVGEILQSLEESGAGNNTLVMFVSDHGMPFPFAKTQLYHHSTLTPLIVRWPGTAQAGAIDTQHMVSAVDFLPTIVDAVGGAVPESVQGRSFLPLLKSQTQSDRNFIIKEYNENASGNSTPMRGVQSKRYLYLFNPWSNGKRRMLSATLKSKTYGRMRELAQRDPIAAERLRALNYRAPQEFYDVVADPDCLHNLIDAPQLQLELEQHQQWLGQWMEETGDHALQAFKGRDEPAVVAAYMQEQEASAKAAQRWKRAIRDSMKAEATAQ